MIGFQSLVESSSRMPNSGKHLQSNLWNLMWLEMKKRMMLEGYAEENDLLHGRDASRLGGGYAGGDSYVDS